MSFPDLFSERGVDHAIPPFLFSSKMTMTFNFSLGPLRSYRRKGFSRSGVFFVKVGAILRLSCKPIKLPIFFLLHLIPFSTIFKDNMFVSGEGQNIKT